MGLTAYFYRTKGKGMLKPLHARDPKKDIQIGTYFRNNWGLHNVIAPHSERCLLDLDILEHIKEEAIESQELVDEGFYHGSDRENVNKDWGEGQSVLSVIDEAIEAVKNGHFVYYTASY